MKQNDDWIEIRVTLLMLRDFLDHYEVDHFEPSVRFWFFYTDIIDDCPSKLYYQAYDILNRLMHIFFTRF